EVKSRGFKNGVRITTGTESANRPQADYPDEYPTGTVALLTTIVLPEWQGLYFNGELVAERDTTGVMDQLGSTDNPWTWQIGYLSKFDLASFLLYDHTASLNELTTTGQAL